MKIYDYVVNVVKQEDGQYYVEFNVKNHRHVRVYIKRPDRLLKSLYWAEHQPLTSNQVMKDLFDTMKSGEVLLINGYEFDVYEYLKYFNNRGLVFSEHYDIFDDNDNTEVALNEDQIYYDIGMKRAYRMEFDDTLTQLSNVLYQLAVTKNEYLFELFLDYVYEYIFGSNWYDEGVWMDQRINWLYHDFTGHVDEFDDDIEFTWAIEYDAGIQDLFDERLSMLDYDLRNQYFTEKQGVHIQ